MLPFNDGSGAFCLIFRIFSLQHEIFRQPEISRYTTRVAGEEAAADFIRSIRQCTVSPVTTDSRISRCPSTSASGQNPDAGPVSFQAEAA
jgi:hypothetical protein